MGFAKPETGVLEVETGRIIGGRKEIKIIESDEAYLARIEEHKKLDKFEFISMLTPLILILICLYLFIFWFDYNCQPHQSFIIKWEKENDKK